MTSIQKLKAALFEPRNCRQRIRQFGTVFRHRLIYLAVVALSFGTVFVPNYVRAEEIRIFAAASLKLTLDDVVAEFEQGHDTIVSLTFAGSPLLARQIELGAPADIYVSANMSWMQYLTENNSVIRSSVRQLLSNSLVLISVAPEQGPRDREELRARLTSSRLAMAQYDVVPAGIYGKAALESLGVWDKVQKNIVSTDNVRSALQLVARGAVPYGIVYGSDLIAAPSVHHVMTFPDSSHPTITYAAGIVTGQERQEVREFFNFMFSPAASEIFARNGFISLSTGLARE